MTEISKEYAEALFALGMENDETAEYAELLEEVSDILRENPAYMDLLRSPNIARSERILAVEAAFGSSMPEYMLSFLKLLVEKGRIGDFEECVAEYMKLYDASKMRVIAKVTTAIEMTSNEKIKLTEKLEKMSGKGVIVENVVDKSVIGGMIVEMDGKIIDGSLKRRLRDVKDVISR